MFHAIGRAVARRGIWLIVAWLVLLGTVWRTAPEWNDVAKQGEFGFLPDYTASRQSQKLLNQAFPDDVIGSSVVLVVQRAAADSGLTEFDQSFVNETLVPRLRELAEKDTVLFSRVRSPTDELVGPLLVGSDGRAVLVLIELRTDFFDLRNRAPLDAIEKLLAELNQSKAVPSGLTVSLSGSATVGRDLNSARIELTFEPACVVRVHQVLTDLNLTRTSFDGEMAELINFPNRNFRETNNFFAIGLTVWG